MVDEIKRVVEISSPAMCPFRDGNSFRCEKLSKGNWTFTCKYSTTFLPDCPLPKVICE